MEWNGGAVLLARPFAFILYIPIICVYIYRLRADIKIINEELVVD